MRVAERIRAPGVLGMEATVITRPLQAIFAAPFLRRIALLRPLQLQHE